MKPKTVELRDDTERIRIVPDTPSLFSTLFGIDRNSPEYLAALRRNAELFAALEAFEALETGDWIN